jgi:carbon monoxide dehydrogenase subunit G
MPEPVSGSESIDIAAPPEFVWRLISDITRMGEWSPETSTATWTGGSSGPIVGAAFVGHNRRGRLRWKGRCEVTVADEPREFAFVRKGPDGGTTWRYRLEADNGHTTVTESFSQAKLPPLPVQLFGRLIFGSDRHQQLLNSVGTTLAGSRPRPKAKPPPEWYLSDSALAVGNAASSIVR